MSMYRYVGQRCKKAGKGSRSGCNKIQTQCWRPLFTSDSPYGYPDYLARIYSRSYVLSGNSGAIYIDERRAIFREANWKTLEGSRWLHCTYTGGSYSLNRMVILWRLHGARRSSYRGSLGPFRSRWHTTLPFFFDSSCSRSDCNQFPFDCHRFRCHP